MVFKNPKPYIRKLASALALSLIATTVVQPVTADAVFHVSVQPSTKSGGSGGIADSLYMKQTEAAKHYGYNIIEDTWTTFKASCNYHGEGNNYWDIDKNGGGFSFSVIDTTDMDYNVENGEGMV